MLAIILTLAGVLIPSAVALVVAYLHRKQMRQVEAFRLDPSVGLVPPPSTITRFLKQNRLILVATVLAPALLIAQGLLPGPISAWRVIGIALAAIIIPLAISVDLGKHSVESMQSLAKLGELLQKLFMAKAELDELRQRNGRDAGVTREPPKEA